jgi:hypothetical protein
MRYLYIMKNSTAKIAMVLLGILAVLIALLSEMGKI